MNREELNIFLDDFTKTYGYYARELYYNYTQVQRINTRWIQVTSVDEKYIHFTYYGYAQERLNTKISYNHFNEYKRQNHVERLRHE